MDFKEGMHNPYVTCPYNRAHEVPKLRLQRHLLKCRKQHGYLNWKSCPFNATHVVPEMELNLHFEYCTDRNLIEGAHYSLNSAHGDLGHPSFHPEVPIEDWSDDRPGQNNHQDEGLRNARRRYGDHQQIDIPVQDEGALSQVEVTKLNPALLGFGRGRIHQIVAEMKEKQCP